MFKKKIDEIKFRISCFRVKHTHWKLIRHYLKMLKFCLYHINKIGIPISDEEIEITKRAVCLYEETIMKLYKDISRAKKYVGNEMEAKEEGN